MATVDVYRITNQLDDATLDVLMARLEARGKHPRFEAMMRKSIPWRSTQGQREYASGNSSSIDAMPSRSAGKPGP